MHTASNLILYVCVALSLTVFITYKTTIVTKESNAHQYTGKAAPAITNQRSQMYPYHEPVDPIEYCRGLRIGSAHSSVALPLPSFPSLLPLRTCGCVFAVAAVLREIALVVCVAKDNNELLSPGELPNCGPTNAALFAPDLDACGAFDTAVRRLDCNSLDSC
jgi:hypothetical protein